MASANYPDWVMKYKSKGVYVNKVGNTYYLYRAHCVYDKTTKKINVFLMAILVVLLKKMVLFRLKIKFKVIFMCMNTACISFCLLYLKMSINL